MEPLTIEKLESSIKIAKEWLEENPHDTWVQKGLEVMEKELNRLKEERFK